MTNKADKFDDGKLKMSLIDPDFLWSLVTVMQKGEAKYGTDNWKLDIDTTRLFDALQRHVWAYQAGETNDPESGESHLSHIAANAMMIFYQDNKPNVGS